MNTEQQRIAIAETCGFINVRMWGESCIASIGVSHKGEYWGSLGVPDYLNDLNAMHEAEKLLTEEQLYIYGNQLDRITLPKTKMEMCYVHGPEAGMYPDLFRATAAQRAEAFLRTIGKWTTNPNEP
jgi:hypothetical protein